MDVAVCVVILVACVTTAALALLAMQAYLEHRRTVGRMRSTQASLEMVFKLKLEYGAAGRGGGDAAIAFVVVAVAAGGG